MALEIPCPHCGPRPYTEFGFGGEPRPVGVTGVEEDFAQVYLGENVAGPRTERWFHALGCKRWLTITRDTRTNEVVQP